MDYSVDISGNDTEAELKNISCTAIQGRPEPSVTFYLGRYSGSVSRVQRHGEDNFFLQEMSLLQVIELKEKSSMMVIQKMAKLLSNTL